MTKREWNKETKFNYGGVPARDERDAYRASRGLPLGRYFGRGRYIHTTRDRLADRANEARWERISDASWAVLGIGSRFRAPACMKFFGRMPRLPGRRPAGLYRIDRPTLAATRPARVHAIRKLVGWR